jgi:hypothetical protein
VQLLPTDQRPAQQPEPKPALELLDVPLTVTRRAEALQDPKFVILPSRSTQPILTPGPSTVGDYMQRIGRLRQPPAILSLVRFTLCDPTCPLADLDRFLRPSNGPADLLIDVGDDCSLIALRAIDDPSPWIEKVQGAWWAAVLRGSTRPGTAFEAEWLGSWPWPPSEELLMLLGANRDFARAA